MNKEIWLSKFKSRQ